MLFQKIINSITHLTKQIKMATTTAFNYNLVIYIPRMNTFWATPEKVKEVFIKQNIGMVSRVDIIKKRVTKQRKRERKHVGGDYMRSAHVYFKTWFDTEANRNLQARIMDPNKEARVVIDEPWYWLLLESQRNQDEQRIYHTESLVNVMIYHITLRDEETKAEFKKQNEAIQRLQDFCITQGLEIPFWDNKDPPAAEVSSMEALAAETAAKTAEHVLNGEYEDDDEEYSLMEAALTAGSAAEYALLDNYDPLNPTYGYTSDAVRGNADYIPLPKYLGKCVRAHTVYDEEDYYPEADAHENDFYPIINEPAVYERRYSAGETMPFRDREGDYNEMVRHYGKEAADQHFSYYYRN
jgi:hypothetical protein